MERERHLKHLKAVLTQQNEVEVAADRNTRFRQYLLQKVSLFLSTPPKGKSVNTVTTLQPAHALFYCHIFSIVYSL